VIAGCGSSSEAAPLTKAAFVKQGNAICHRAAEDRKRGTREVVSSAADADDEAGALTEALLAPVKTMTEELGDLGPPKRQEKQLETIVSAFEAGVAKVEEDPGSSRTPFVFDKADKLAAQFGLTECSI
jgi:hypothetical protein